MVLLFFLIKFTVIRLSNIRDVVNWLSARKMLQFPHNMNFSLNIFLPSEKPNIIYHFSNPRLLWSLEGKEDGHL